MSPKPPAKQDKRSKGPKTSGEPRPGRQLVPQPHGGALLPGGTGAGGRPPNWLRDFAIETLDRPETRAAAQAILADKDHKGFAPMYAKFADLAGNDRAALLKRVEASYVAIRQIVLTYVPDASRLACEDEIAQALTDTWTGQ